MRDVRYYAVHQALNMVLVGCAVTLAVVADDPYIIS